MNPQVVVIGRGSAAARILRLLPRTLPDCEVVSVASTPVAGCDARHLASLELLDPQGVLFAFDCSPASTRLEHAKILTSWGLPTLFEKPLAVTARLGESVLDLYGRLQVPVWVGYNLKKLDAFSFLGSLLEQGAIGPTVGVEIRSSSYLPDWRPSRDYRSSVSAQKKLGGGVLLELSHELNYAISLWGKVEKVWGSTDASGELDLDVEDRAVGILEMEGNDVTIRVELDFVSRVPERWCRVSGENGSLLWDLLDNSISFTTSAGESKTAFHDDVEQTYVKEIMQFALSSDEVRASQRADNQDALDTLRVIDGWKLSAQTGEQVSLSGEQAIG